MPSAVPIPHVRFAGWEAVFGFWLFVFYWSTLGLLVLMIGIAGATGSFDFPVGVAEVLTYLLCAAGVTWFGWFVLRSLGRCRTVDLTDDGVWILRNILGRELGRISRETPRRVSSWSQKVTSFGPSVRIWRRSFAEITDGQRTWRSCYSIPKVTTKAIAALQSPPFL